MSTLHISVSKRYNTNIKNIQVTGLLTRKMYLLKVTNGATHHCQTNTLQNTQLLQPTPQHKHSNAPDSLNGNTGKTNNTTTLTKQLEALPGDDTPSHTEK